MKTCNKCGESKLEEDFYPKRGSCIACVRKSQAKYRAENQDEIKVWSDATRDERNETRRNYRAAHRDEVLLEKKKYRAKNADKIKLQNRTLHRKHKTKRNESSKKYYASHKEEILKYRAAYKKENAVRCRETKRKNHIQRMINDPAYATNMQIRWNINSAFRRKGVPKSKKCLEYGINLREIFDKIGSRPKDQELDHIIPLTMFDFNNPLHVKLAYAPENLRWVTKQENNKKRSSIITELLTPELEKILKIIENSQKSLTM
jgi:hypothetical protein